MSVEKTVEDAAEELGDAIARLPEYEAFAAAKGEVEDSPEAQEKIEAFERRRQDFMMARQAGDASQEDLAELQRAQEELHAVPAMADYLEAQAELEARLETINEAISEPLAVDFGETAGGCCQD
jgi:cell fate (sporulation/competence/biofilm development) regulator YlbF (YheA/YmcA/DUF963 family)